MGTVYGKTWKTWSFFGRQWNHQYRQKAICTSYQQFDQHRTSSWREKSYEELMMLLTEHYNPAQSEIVERYKFHMRMRHEGETVSTFVAELHSLVQYCKFGASLNDLLRDWIVCGINDENIQWRLLAEKTLTVNSALDIEVGMESARKNVTELQTPARKPTEVYKVTTMNCHRCGNSSHIPDRCRFRHVKCLTCCKTGHIQRVCRLLVETEKSTLKSWRNHGSQPIRQLTQEQEGLDLEEFIKHLGTSEDAIELEVSIEGKLVNMQLDTGASVEHQCHWS